MQTGQRFIADGESIRLVLNDRLVIGAADKLLVGYLGNCGANCKVPMHQPYIVADSICYCLLHTNEMPKEIPMF